MQVARLREVLCLQQLLLDSTLVVTEVKSTTAFADFIQSDT